MKAVEELDVSPMPWREASYGLIVSSDNKKVADFFGSGYDPKGPDFIMMMSAPKLYEAGDAAYDALEGLCPWYGKCVKCLHGCRVAKDGEWLDSNSVYCNKSDRKDCMVFIALSKLRAALEEACSDVNADAGDDNLAARVRDCLDEVAPSEEAQRLLNEDNLK